MNKENCALKLVDEIILSNCHIIMGSRYPISQCVPLYTSLSLLTTAATNGITQNAQYGPKN